MAEVERILCAPHSACSEVGLQTALHLTTSTPNSGYAEIIDSILYTMDGFVDSILTKPIQIKDGLIRANDGPGFGLELNERVLEKYRIK
jgi:L-alanine-DL-glutamate epimerase-like enolase superfamily enzyme